MVIKYDAHFVFYLAMPSQIADIFSGFQRVLDDFKHNKIVIKAIGLKN